MSVSVTRHRSPSAGGMCGAVRTQCAGQRRRGGRAARESFFRADIFNIYPLYTVYPRAEWMHVQYGKSLGVLLTPTSKSDMRVRRLRAGAQGEGRGEAAWDPLVNERSVRPQTF